MRCRVIISILSEKGGVSKTTLTINLAFCLYQKNFKVAVIDTDQQQNLTNFFADRIEENFTYFCDTYYITDTKEIKEKSKGYDFVLIDCAPKISQNLTQVIDLSDISLLLLKVSQLDFYTIQNIINIAHKLKKKDSLKVLFTQVNQYQHKLKREAEETIKENFNVRVMNNFLSYSNDYINSISKFRTVFETKSKKKAEIQLIVDEIIGVQE